MAILNFPTNPTPGQTYAIGSITYTWNGQAWFKSTQGNTTFGNVTATIITVGTGTQSVIITGGNITIGGDAVLTTASLATLTLQQVTNYGSTTTNIVYFTNTSTSTTTDTGAVIVTGGLGVGGRINSESLQLADTVFDTTQTPVTTTNATAIDQYPVTLYRTSKYLVQIDDSDTDSFQTSELLMLVANTGTSYSTFVTEYAVISNNGDLGSFASQVEDIGGGVLIAKLIWQAFSASNKTVKVLRIGMTP